MSLMFFGRLDALAVSAAMVAVSLGGVGVVSPALADASMIAGVLLALPLVGAAIGAIWSFRKSRDAFSMLWAGLLGALIGVAVFFALGLAAAGLMAWAWGF